MTSARRRARARRPSKKPDIPLGGPPLFAGPYSHACGVGAPADEALYRVMSDAWRHRRLRLSVQNICSIIGSWTRPSPV